MLPVQLISAFAPSEEMFLPGVTALRILGLSFVSGGISVMICYALQGFSRGISSLIISSLRQVIILLPLASVLGKMMGINGIVFFQSWRRNDRVCKKMIVQEYDKYKEQLDKSGTKYKILSEKTNEDGLSWSRLRNSIIQRQQKNVIQHIPYQSEYHQYQK